MKITKTTGILGAVAVALAATIGGFLALQPDVTHVAPMAVPSAPNTDLQAAIDAAQCGELIQLDAGAAYTVNLTLPKKDCSEFITIQSSRAAELPEGRRITPVQFPLLAKLQSAVNAEPVIKTAAGAHHYKFVGMEIVTVSPDTVVYDLVRFGESRHAQATLESRPSQLILDRSYVHGWPTQGVQRGLSLNCADCGVINSHLSEIHGVGFDTQAVCGWNGTERAYVINNYLEAAGENVMIGGADPASEAFVPTNVEIRRNYIRKPPEWKGKGWVVKNLLEVKNCRGCTVDGNVLENNWGGEGQAGVAVLFTVRNQEGTAPYSIIANTTFTNNTVRNSPGALNFLGSDNEKPSQRAAGALVANNVFDGITGAFLTLNGFYSLTVERNTHLQTCTEGCNTMTLYGEQSHNFIYRDNVTQEKPYGVFGDGGTVGRAALDKFAPGWVFTGNVMATPYGSNPAGNDYPAALAIAADYRTGYPGKGADIDALLAAQAGAQPSPQPSVSVSPTLSPSPIATATATPTPVPTATATPTVVPPPSPSPQLRFCVSGERPGTPPRCRCRNGFLGNSGKCR